MNHISKSAAALALAGILSGCLLDEKKEIAKTASGEYVVTVTSLGDGGTDYIMTVASLDTGTISATGRGIEQTGWRHMHTLQNMFFSVGYNDDNHLIGYVKDESGTDLVEKGRFAFPATLDLLSDVNATAAVAMEVPRKGVVPRTLFRLDLDNVAIADTAIHPIYQVGNDTIDGLVAWPSGMVHRDGKLFVSFYQVHARGDFSTPNTDTAFVAVYDYPSLAFEKVIKDSRAGAIGLYGNNRGIIKTESGDLYTYTCASKVCNTTDSTVTHSKILRIASGSTDWDASYEFDFEAATGKKLVWFAPVGGDLAIARAMAVPAGEASGTPGDASVRWSVLSSFESELYLIDLAAQTATAVTGVPAHKGGYRMGVFVEDGKAYVPVLTEDTHHIYAVDLATAAGTQGAAIVGAGVKLIAR